MNKQEFLELAKNTSTRGLGVKVAKNPQLKYLLYDITSFLPENAPQKLRLWCVKNNILSKEDLPKCPVCGKLPAYSTGNFLTYCSKRCAQLDKEKFLNKYGVEHHLKSRTVREKIKQTVLEKYGVENVGIITREKAKQTMIEKYGVDNYTKTEEYKEKLLTTSLKKYGTTHPSKSAKVKAKLKQSLASKREEINRKVKKTLLSRYGVNTPMKISHVKEKVLKNYKMKMWEKLIKKLDKNNIEPVFPLEEFLNIKVKTQVKLKFKCKKCGTVFLDHLNNGNIPVCPECFKNQTKPEKIIIDFLHKNKIPLETNNRTVLSPFEVDIFIPDKKMGIEVNGIYFHTYENLMKFRRLSVKEAQNYHRLKWILSTEKNIKLLQFWDSEIIKKTDTVLSIISNILGLSKKIYARECEVMKLDEKDAYNFFVENHVYDEPVIGKTYALIYNGEIVQAISVGKARFKLSGHEIYRFATKNFHKVLGGLSKLLSFMLKEEHINTLYSYVDLRLFNGSSLERLGFKRVKITKPNYYYTDNFINLISRENFMKSKTGVNERQYTIGKFHKIFDCGHALYKLEIK